MSGLLLKEWYMMKKYCRAYLLIAAMFLVLSCIEDNLFFTFYPCLLCSMIPVNLLSYDERCGWDRYSGTLPCTKRQLVSSKYLVGLLTTLAVMAVTGVVQAVRLNTAQGLGTLGDYLLTMLAMWMTAAVSISLTLPVSYTHLTLPTTPYV